MKVKNLWLLTIGIVLICLGFSIFALTVILTPRYSEELVFENRDWIGTFAETCQWSLTHINETKIEHNARSVLSYRGYNFTRWELTIEPHDNDDASIWGYDVVIRVWGIRSR